jgi:hypothetical protein
MKYIGFSLLAVLMIVIAIKVSKNSRAQHYLVNCKRVEPGMTVKQAERIMGDEDGSDHSVGKGELQYITPSFARTGTIIYFNPEADLVTEVICGDQKWSGF